MLKKFGIYDEDIYNEKYLEKFSENLVQTLANHRQFNKLHI